MSVCIDIAYYVCFDVLVRNTLAGALNERTFENRSNGTKIVIEKVFGDGEETDTISHMKFFGKFLPVALILTGFLFTGCRPLQMSSTSSGKIWVASDMTALTSDTKPFVDKNIVGDRGQIKLFAAGNETVSFQMIVDAPDGDVPELSVTSQGLSGDKNGIIAAENIRVFHMLPVMVQKYPAWYIRSATGTLQPAEFYGPLVPIDSPQGGQPYNIKKNKRLGLWVDIHVPPAAAGENYKGKLVISTGLASKKSLNIELSVYNFALADTKPILAAGGFGRRDKLKLNTIRKMMRIAHDHRLDLFDKELFPKIHRNIKGQLQLDWSNFDALAKPCLDGSGFEDGIPCSIWPIPFTENYPMPDYYGGISSDNYARTAREFVSLCTKHFRKLGAEKQMFAWPIRQPPRDEQFSEEFGKKYAKFVRLAAIIRSAEAKLPILSQLPATPPLSAGWNPPENFVSHVDILAPGGNWFDPAESLKRYSSEAGITGGWLSPAPPPYLPQISIISPPSDIRAIPWFGIKYKCRGIFLPEVLNRNGNSFDSDGIGRTTLFYLGSKFGAGGVLASVQLKQLRRGLQDTAYIGLLRSRNKHAAERIVNAMARYAGCDAIGDHYLDPRAYGLVSSGPAWIEARSLLGAEIEKIVNHDPQSLSESAKIAARVRWKQFVDKTHRVRIERIRTSVIPKEADSTFLQGFYGKILVDLHNEFPRQLDCRLDITSLPKGWKPAKGSCRIRNFKPGEQRTVELIVEWQNAATLSNANAKLPVGFSISYDGRVQRNTGGFVPLLLAGKFSAVPTIDGNLDDWPGRENSIAGNFRLLGQRGRLKGDARFSGLAKRQTTVQVMQDSGGKYIYFAIICSEPTPEKLIAHPSNIIRYEQLLASNEDMVEILIDPGQNAKTPEDLYHIVVKPNGVVIQERGIRTNPPLCKTAPANLGARVAVSKDGDAWIIEMKIPRCAFGPHADSRFWGVNFTRFATPGSEASSWAKAERNFYSPKSLGTMILVKTKPTQD